MFQNQSFCPRVSVLLHKSVLFSFKSMCVCTHMSTHACRHISTCQICVRGSSYSPALLWAQGHREMPFNQISWSHGSPHLANVGALNSTSSLHWLITRGLLALKNMDDGECNFLVSLFECQWQLCITVTFWRIMNLHDLHQGSGWQAACLEGGGNH